MSIVTRLDTFVPRAYDRGNSVYLIECFALDCPVRNIFLFLDVDCRELFKQTACFRHVIVIVFVGFDDAVKNRTHVLSPYLVCGSVHPNRLDMCRYITIKEAC